MASEPPFMPRVLVIAGSDSGGGAGIQADIKVITCLGGYAMTAITALTAQDTLGVHGIYPVPAEFVIKQAEACLADIGVDAVKTGMLWNAEIVHAVAEFLKKHKPPNVVVDPVMVSKSGDSLLSPDAVKAMIEELLPLADVVTPNIEEAGRLAGMEMEATSPAMKRAARAILALGPRAVIVKGGHMPKRPMDVVLTREEEVTLPGERIQTKNTHGTGCSFASALATELGRGLRLDKAAYQAKRFITEAIRHSLNFGHGHGPTNPLAGARAVEKPS
jgi:hydroxymethylpyrimidine kinase/phosphomethylpyrimidine kinase